MVCIAATLELLLELEYKYGTPVGFTPGITDVYKYLEKVINSCTMMHVTLRIKTATLHCLDPVFSTKQGHQNA